MNNKVKKLLQTSGGVFAAFVGADMIKMNAGKSILGLTFGGTPSIVAGGGAVLAIGGYYAFQSAVGLIADIIDEHSDDQHTVNGEKTTIESNEQIPGRKVTTISAEIVSPDTKRDNKGRFVKQEPIDISD